MGLVGTLEDSNDGEVIGNRGDVKKATSNKPTDESFRIDLMSSQLGQCRSLVLILKRTNHCLHRYSFQQLAHNA